MFTQIFVNLGYFLMLVGLTVRDILWLRTILVSAQVSLITYGLSAANYPVVFWNSLFFLMNSYQLVRLIRERRPIEIPPEILDLYEKIFPSMTQHEFLYFWNMGHIKEVRNKVLIRQGEKQNMILLILNGHVEVFKKERRIAQLGRGSFVAEMSFLTREPATADVRANDTVRYIFWNQEKLRSLNQLNSTLYIKIQNILGRDLAEKIKVASNK